MHCGEKGKKLESLPPGMRFAYTLVSYSGFPRKWKMNLETYTLRGTRFTPCFNKDIENGDQVGCFIAGLTQFIQVRVNILHKKTVVPFPRISKETCAFFLSLYPWKTCLYITSFCDFKPASNRHIFSVKSSENSRVMHFISIVPKTLKKKKGMLPVKQKLYIS